MGSQLVAGVIGGMGPEATIDLMYRVFQQTPASDDGEHIRILVDNNPKVPSRIKAIIEGTGVSPAKTMTEMALGLVNQGADFLVIPCNTAHYYYDDVSSAVDVPVINLLDLTATHIRKERCLRVGLLGSTALQITQIYAPTFEKHHLSPIYPDQTYQDELMELIKKIKAKQFSTIDIETLQSVSRHMISKDVDCIALVCTELSVVKQYIETEVPLFDALELLSVEIIDWALRNKPNERSS